MKKANSFVIHSAAVPDKGLSLGGACSTMTCNFLMIQSEADVSANFLRPQIKDIQINERRTVVS